MKKYTKYIVVIAILITMIIGMDGVGAGAWFSDTASSTNNTLTAATLKLKVNDVDTSSQTFMLGNIKPGDYTFGGEVTLKNTGSIPGKLSYEIANVSPGNGPLGALVYAEFYTNGIRLNGTSVINQSTGTRVNIGNLDPNESIGVQVYFNWPLGENDNSAQGATLTFEVVWHLDQVP